MKLITLLEGKTDKLTVVYGGRFQPFHKGHAAAYKWLQDKFGADRVWIATSDKTTAKSADKPNPLSFTDKKQVMTRIHKINPDRIVCCKNPAFGPSEIFSKVGDGVIYVAACGAKNRPRYAKGSFFKELPEDIDHLTPVSEKRGYYVLIPMQEDGISGTEAREQIARATESELPLVIKRVLGDYDIATAKMLKKRFS